MARLLLPNLPLYLYRYRPADRSKIDREINALTEPYIWCADFHALNDPMEGFYRPSRALRQRSNYDDIVQQIYDRKIRVGIASLSDTKENELMWTHYTGNYSGICIEYYARRFLDALPDNVDLVRMGYDDSPPRVSGNDWRARDEGARKIFSQKKYNWAYEREWRVLGSIGKVTFNSKEVVRSVYLGSRIDPDSQNKILRALAGSEVDIYEMDIDGYRHDWSPIQGPKYEKKLKRRKSASTRKVVAP